MGGQAYIMTTLLATPGPATAIDGTGKVVADALLEAATALQAQTGTAKTVPDAFVVAPDVFLKLATAKASTSGQYLSGQPLAAAPILTLWGLPLVVSGAVAPGRAIVGSFRGWSALSARHVPNRHGESGSARVARRLQAEGIRRGAEPRRVDPRPALPTTFFRSLF